MAVSDSESIVLAALWETSPQTAEEVIAAVAEPQGWSPATVKTLLNRLLKKKAIRAEKEGRRFLYAPLISREDYIRSQSQSLLDRLFDGKVAPLVSHFSKTQSLSDEDIAALRKIVEDLDDDQ